MKICASLSIKEIFTSGSKPKGNAYTERVIRTQKEDLSAPMIVITLLLFKEHYLNG